MARRGDGIQQRGKTWWLDLMHRGERHVVRIGSHINRTIAKELAQVERGKVLRGEAGIGRQRKDVSFKGARKRFEEWLRANRKAHTADSYAECLDRLAKTFESKRLGQITTAELERYKESRLTGERGKVSVNRELAVLSSMFNRCRTWGFVEGENPATKATRFKESRGRIRFLEWDEEARLLAAATEPPRTIILLGTDAGLRIEAEALTLPWSGIDFRRDLVTVGAGYAKNSEQRSIPMTPRLKEALVAHRFRQGKQDLAQPVFVNRRGDPLRSIRNIFDAARVAAKLGDDVTPHVCRHTFASRLVMAGADIRTVQELIGHKRIEMTMRYSRLSPQHKARAVALLTPPAPEKFHNAIHNTAPETASKTV
jgi:site-specific recombinase XerD